MHEGESLGVGAARRGSGGRIGLRGTINDSFFHFILVYLHFLLGMQKAEDFFDIPINIFVILKKSAVAISHYSFTSCSLFT